MNKFFSENLPWKIASLALATMLWVFVINTQNPMQPKTITGVSVNIRGTGQLEEKGYVIQNEEKLRSQKVTVEVKGSRLQIDRLLANKGLIDIRIDLAQNVKDIVGDSDVVQTIGVLEGNIPLEGIVITDISPKFTQVVFEKEKRTILPIEYNIVGKGKDNYVAKEPIIKPTEIEIWGPQSYIESIATAAVNIDMNEFSEDMLSSKLPIKLLDIDGKEVMGVKKTPQFAEVTLPIGKKKKVPVEPAFTGTLPEGYLQSNIIINPKELTIVGKPEIIDTIETIKLNPIVLDNLIQSTTLKVDFVLPKGIEYVDKIESKATVTIEIKKQNSYEYRPKTEDLKIDVANLGEGLKYELIDKDFKLVLGATAEELLAFKVDTLRGKIDLKDLGAGEYAIPIQFNISDAYTVINTPLTINVRISPIDTGVVTPTPTATPIPTTTEEDNQS